MGNSAKKLSWKDDRDLQVITVECLLSEGLGGARNIGLGNAGENWFGYLMILFIIYMQCEVNLHCYCKSLKNYAKDLSLTIIKYMNCVINSFLHGTSETQSPGLGHRICHYLLLLLHLLGLQRVRCFKNMQKSSKDSYWK